MKILQLCHRVPVPPSDGGTLAMYNLTKGFIANGIDVQILALNTLKHFIDTKDLLINSKPIAPLDAVTVDTSANARDALRYIFSNNSYNIVRFYSAEFDEKLKEILSAKEFNLIQLESLFMVPYLETIRKYSTAKVVLRSHNVEFKIWERMTALAPFGFKKAYFKHLTDRLKNYEISHLNSYDMLVAITEEDADFFKSSGCNIPIAVAPFAVAIDDYKMNSTAVETHSLFHLGSMDWMPNIEAMKWFLETVWKKIHKKFPDLKFYIAGRNMPDEFKNLKLKNVEVIEDVNDAKKFISSKQIMVVPLQTGSGMRVKIIEGMALGKTVISTSIGAEGIDSTHLKNILIANTPDEYIYWIEKCLLDKTLSETIGSNAKSLIETTYDNKIISKNLIQLYQNICN